MANVLSIDHWTDPQGTAKEVVNRALNYHYTADSGVAGTIDNCTFTPKRTGFIRVTLHGLIKPDTTSGDATYNATISSTHPYADLVDTQMFAADITDAEINAGKIAGTGGVLYYPFSASVCVYATKNTPVEVYWTITNDNQTTYTLNGVIYSCVCTFEYDR